MVIVSLSISRYSSNTPSETKLHGLRRFIRPQGAAYLLRERRNGRNFNTNEMNGKGRIFCIAATKGIKENSFNPRAICVSPTAKL
jgi:hypothetical protein